jgi:hypothetical protein
MFRFLLLFLGLFFVATFVTNSVSATEYLSTWTSVRKSCDKQFTSEGTKLLLHPTVCLDLDPVREEVLNKTADYYSDHHIVYELVKNSDRVLVIRTKRCHFEHGMAYRVVCDPPEDTLIQAATPLALHKIAPNIFFDNPQRCVFISDTNAPAARNDYVVYKLDAEDQPTSAKKVIFSNPSSKTALGASAAPDGGMAVQLIADSKSWTMSTRRLKNGIPIAAPSSWTVPAYSGYSPDISNAIDINTGSAGASAARIRYLVFRTFRNVSTTSQQSQIMIQTIDDATGKPLNDPTPVTNFAKAFQAGAEAIQSIAIAPDAKFMLFTVYSDACKKQILKQVNLVNGEVAGGAKTIANCSGLAASPAGIVGVDIMMQEVPGTSLSK